MKERWTVFTLLASGGDFGVGHVLAMDRMLKRYFQPEYRHVCVTDLSVPGVACVAIPQGWKKWWGKVEILALADATGGPCAYFDLDAVMLRPFTPPDPAANELWMAKDFMFFLPRGDYNSSTMFWRSGLGFIAEEARAKGLIWLKMSYPGDQDFIRAQMEATEGKTIRPVDDVLTLASYKVNRLAGKPAPEGVDIVCFHGLPRPWQVQDVWVKEATKE